MPNVFIACDATKAISSSRRSLPGAFFRRSMIVAASPARPPVALRDADLLLQFAVEGRNFGELLKESRPLRERNRRVGCAAPGKQIERPLPDVGRNVLGAARAPDRAAFFARDRRQTGFIPRSPVQGERGQASGATTRDEGIKERIGGSVIDLPGRADQAQYRREHDEMREFELVRETRAEANRRRPWARRRGRISASPSA